MIASKGMQGQELKAIISNWERYTYCDLQKKMVGFIKLFVWAMEYEIICLFFDQCRGGIWIYVANWTNVLCKIYFALGTISVLCK